MLEDEQATPTLDARSLPVDNVLGSLCSSPLMLEPTCGLSGRSKIVRMGGPNTLYSAIVVGKEFEMVQLRLLYLDFIGVKSLFHIHTTIGQ